MSLFPFLNEDLIVKDAYHGTLAESAESILRTDFRSSDDDQLYLGSGVYFFESSAEWAEYWGRRKAKGKGRGIKIAVLTAEILLGRCINLSDREHQFILAKFALEVEKRVRSGSLAVKFAKMTEAFILNLAAKTSHADTIKAAYADTPRGRPLHQWSRFDFSMRIMICVRRSENIRNVAIFLLEK